MTDLRTSQAKPLSGFALALIANLLWGSSFLASKVTLQAWGPVTASVLRFALAVAVMAIGFPLLGLRLRFPSQARERLWLVAISVFGFGALYPLQLSGLTQISSGLSAALMLTSPLFLLLAGSAFLGEKLSSRKLLAILLGMGGGLILLNGSHGLQGSHGIHSLGEPSRVLGGSLLTLAASLSLALSVIATRKLAGALDAANVTFWSMLLGLLLLLPLSLWSLSVPASRSHAPVTLSAVLALGYLAIVCSVVCFVLWNQAISRAPAKELATTMHVKTPAAILLGVVFAQEPLTGSLLCGAAVVTAGVWLSQTEKR